VEKKATMKKGHDENSGVRFRGKIGGDGRSSGKGETIHKPRACKGEGYRMVYGLRGAYWRGKVRNGTLKKTRDAVTEKNPVLRRSRLTQKKMGKKNNLERFKKGRFVAALSSKCQKNVPRGLRATADQTVGFAWRTGHPSGKFQTP